MVTPGYVADPHYIDNDILKQYGGLKSNDLNALLRTFDDSDDEIRTLDHSHYYEWDGLREVIATSKENFFILSVNIQSIRAKFDKLMALMKYLNEKDCIPSAVCVQETWLRKNDDTSLVHIPGYNLIHQGLQCSEHGGLIIYLSDTFTYRIRDIGISSSRWEGLFIDVFHDNLKSKVIIGNVYRPPRRNNCNSEIELFLEEFKPIIHTFNKENASIFLPGDYNLNLLDIQEREKIQEYHDLFITNGLFPKITLPTRFSRRSCSLIDQIFCKLQFSKSHSFSGILFGALSDHFGCFTSVNLFKSTKQTKQKFTRVFNTSEKKHTEFLQRYPIET